MPLASNSFRFGPFSLDVRAAELHTNGTKIKLPEQPFQVLSALLENAGEVVTREELRQRLWPADTFVDFDHSLNAAVKRLREALGDSADAPRFIETLPRHGYRFIAPVEKPTAETSRVGGTSRLFQRLTPNKRWLGLAITLLAVVCVIGFWRVSRRKAAFPLPLTEPVPVAVYHGDAFQPAVSPDGDRIVFVAGEGNDFGIYTALVGGENSVRLTNNPRDAFPKWSPDGQQIAFYRFSDQGLSIYTIPALGGTEHRVYDGPSSRWEDAGLDWAPDGETLAITEYGKDKIHSRITLISLSDFTASPLTFPDNNHYDCNPAYSPNGSLLAFERANVSGTTSDLFVIPVNGGNPIPITSDLRMKAGAAWTPDGKQVIFAAMWTSMAGEGGAGLWRVPLSGGTPTPIAGVGAGAYYPSIARSGHRLLYQRTVKKQNIWRLDLKDEKHRLGPPTLLVSEKGNKMRPHLSPDGKKIAFESDRLGWWEIWACDVKGSDCAQLTSLHRIAGAPKWSPDGHYIAFEFHPHEQSEIYLLDVASGQVRLLPTNPGWDNLSPSWSRDGQWLYFASSRAAAPLRFQLWKIPIAAGGSPVQVTKKGGLQSFESVDGRVVYYTKSDVPGIWKVPVMGGEESLVGGDFYRLTFRSWVVCEKGIYLISFRTHPQGTIQFFDFSSGTSTPVWDFEKNAGWGLTLSPDSHSLVYVQEEFDESNVMLVDNFR
jgi:Tol biopolymer transport system component/DNA-binding winged helix-turn-helix (wHTH) protein